MTTFYTLTAPKTPTKPRPIVVVLAPGAGGDRKSPGLVACAKELSTRGIMTLTFDFPYRLKGKKAPDSPSVLYKQFEEAIVVAVKKCASKNPQATSISVVIGGRSMGGRVSSLVAAGYGTKSFDVIVSAKKTVKAKIIGGLFLSYPLHGPGKKERKDSHFADIKQKSLFVSGDRDTFATPAELKSSAKKTKGSSKVVILKNGDHELKTRKTDSTTFEELNGELATNIAAFVVEIRE